MKPHYLAPLMASLACLILVFATLLSITQTHKYQVEDPPGSKDLGEGKLVVYDLPLLTENPKNNPLLAAEELNTLLCILFACNPEKVESLRHARLEDVADALHQELGEDPKKTLDIVQRQNLLWAPHKTPWGLFVSQNHKRDKKRRDSEVPPYGSVHLSLEKKTATYQTESTLNKALRAYTKMNPPQEGSPPKIPSAFELCTFAIKQNQISPPEIPKILAACDLLGITYDPESKLYLSPQSQIAAREWRRWTE